ncbi:MAG: hypothetical protein KJO85_10310, partial [Gammaproteobacteria bacterium]|nr:hypothetical protein [Gammaproteobacteria bacterium]
MMTFFARPKFLSFAAGLAMGLCQATLADDIEIFTGGSGVGSGVAPNVVFIIDTSGSMSSEVQTQPVYDSSETYAGDCESNHIFWAKEGDDPPECDDDEWFYQSALRCAVAAGQLNQNGISALDYFAQWDFDEDSEDKSQWDKLDKDWKTEYVECSADSGDHGNNAGDGEVYAADAGAGPWSSDPLDEVVWGDDDTDELYTLYSGNYLNWTQVAMTQVTTRLEIVQDVTKNLLDNLSGVNVGLMRFSNDGGSDDDAADGGMVIHAVEPVELGRAAMKSKIDGLAPSGWTPLAETMYEAALYFR